MNPNQPPSPVSYNSSPHGGRGSLVIIILLVILLIGSAAFGLMQFSKAQDYKNNVDKKVGQAVTAKTAQLQAQAQQAFDAANTYQYQGSPTYGSITFRYPKGWSGYVDTTNQSEPINGYFQPDVVPGVQSKTAFALRLELLAQDYTQVLQQYNSLVQSHKVTAQAYVPPKLQGVVNVQPGTMFKGAVNINDATQNGTMLVIKVRDKTLKIYTESNDYLADFNNVILAGLTFAP